MAVTMEELLVTRLKSIPLDILLSVELLFKEDTPFIQLCEEDSIFRFGKVTELAKEINITPGELTEWESWFKVDEAYCYLKLKNFLNLFINELLCEKIADYLKIPTIHYQLAKDPFGNIGLLSKNFRKREVDYFYARKDVSLASKKLKVIEAKRTAENKSEKSELAKLLAFAFYTELGDRYVNSLCERTTSSVRMAPLFDYEETFPPNVYDQIDDPYYGKIYYRDFIKIFENDPEMGFYFDTMFKFSMEENLKVLENTNKIQIPEEAKRFYMEYDKHKKEKIKSLRG